MEISDWKGTMTALCRNYIGPAEDFTDIPESTVERFDPESARLIGRKAWQGSGGEMPRCDRMLALNHANHSSFA